jgi:flagellar L-ring protein precursor FlgH
MSQNGGSLLRASLVGPSSLESLAGIGGTAPASAMSVSFFTVAEVQPKKYAKHDVVEIIIQEQSTSSSGGKTALKKSADFDAKLDAFVAFKLSQMELKGIIPGGGTLPEIKSDGSRNFTGTATVDRTDDFTARVAAEVIDVKPNGNLILQAVKQIRADEEDQRIVVSGMCRATDITADNTVLSSQLADFSVQKTNRGAVKDTTERGFIPRLLDRVNPY